MQNFTELNFKWLGETVACPDNNLLNCNYKYYTECEINDIKYEVGIGALIKTEAVSHVGVVHYFYEIPHSVPKVKKYIVVLELYYKPSEIVSNLAKSICLDKDLEVIKKDKVILVHVPVYAIKSRCAIVYGLEDEEPQDLLQEFLGKTNDTIYICRFIAKLKHGLFYLRGAVYNEEDKNVSNNSILIITDNEQTPDKLTSAGNYSVAHVENIASNIKIKLKRQLSDTVDNKQLIATPKKKHMPLILAKKQQQHSPSELMKSLTLTSNQKIELPSQEKVESMNKNIKHLNGRKSALTTLKMDTDEDVMIVEYTKEPIVVLNKIDSNVLTPSNKKTAKIQTRRSSRVKTIERESFVPDTPTRSSKRQIPKVSYKDFQYKIDSSPEKKSTRMKMTKACNDYVVSSPRSTRKQTIENTPSRRRLTVHFDESTTPKKNTPTKNKDIEEPIRQKRTVVDVTPKKQSRVISTPKSGRLNIMSMTPTIEEREKPIVFCDTPMSRARMGLSAYSVPSKMPCRENEYMNIFNFVTGRLRDQSSGCMYISGVPGTGKTMTVCRVMNDLSDQKDEYSDFVFLKLNALALTEPRQIYVEIIKKLLNKKLHWEESLKEIERFFKAKKKKIPHVILVDELDKLCNRKQDVVYNLLDLPFHSTTPLVVITIANTMDLPERILTNKVNSRLGLIRLTFKPYQYKDLVKIVTERLAADAVFKNEALELVARKVAAVSGDARRALAMCSRATEIAEEENKEFVTMDVVDRVIKEMSSSSKVQAIQSCSKLEQYILTSIANEVTRTGNEEVPFLNMIHNLEKLCILDSFKLPSPEMCLKSCHNLGGFRLLITQHGRIDINMTLMLNISTDDIHYALRNN